MADANAERYAATSAFVRKVMSGDPQATAWVNASQQNYTLFEIMWLDVAEHEKPEIDAQCQHHSEL